MDEKEIVTDEEMEKAFAFANYGTMPHRDVLKFAVLKYASGFEQGYTSAQIILELGLINSKKKLTKKGRSYLWAAFSNGSNF